MLLPDCGPLPQTSQTCAMTYSRRFPKCGAKLRLYRESRYSGKAREMPDPVWLSICEIGLQKPEVTYRVSTTDARTTHIVIPIEDFSRPRLVYPVGRLFATRCIESRAPSSTPI